MLLLSLPSSPKADLETDVANGLEGLRPRASMQPTFDNLSPSPSLMLKSKWSSSTIGSAREEDERRSPSTKLRLAVVGSGGVRSLRSSNAHADEEPRFPHDDDEEPPRIWP